MPGNDNIQIYQGVDTSFQIRSIDDSICLPIINISISKRSLDSLCEEMKLFDSNVINMYSKQQLDVISYAEFVSFIDSGKRALNLPRYNLHYSGYDTLTFEGNYFEIYKIRISRSKDSIMQSFDYFYLKNECIIMISDPNKFIDPDEMYTNCTYNLSCCYPINNIPLLKELIIKSNDILYGLNFANRQILNNFH